MGKLLHWIKANKAVSALALAIVTMFSAVLTLLRWWNDINDAKEAGGQIMENWQKIIEFSLSPYFSWIIGVVSILCVSALIIRANERNEKREASNSRIASEERSLVQKEINAHNALVGQLLDYVRHERFLRELKERRCTFEACSDGLIMRHQMNIGKDERPDTLEEQREQHRLMKSLRLSIQASFALTGQKMDMPIETQQNLSKTQTTICTNGLEDGDILQHKKHVFRRCSGLKCLDELIRRHECIVVDLSDNLTRP